MAGDREQVCRRWGARCGGHRGRIRGPHLGGRSPGAATGSWTARVFLFVRPMEGGWGQAKVVFAKITRWRISLGMRFEVPGGMGQG